MGFSDLSGFSGVSGSAKQGKSFMQDATSTLPTSDHFELKQIAEGVYAAIVVAGGGARSNAGIIEFCVNTRVVAVTQGSSRSKARTCCL